MNEHECGLLTDYHGKGNLKYSAYESCLSANVSTETRTLNPGVHSKKMATNCLITVLVVVVTILRRFIPVVVFLEVETHTKMKWILKCTHLHRIGIRPDPYCMLCSLREPMDRNHLGQYTALLNRTVCERYWEVRTKIMEN